MVDNSAPEKQPVYRPPSESDTPGLIKPPLDPYFLLRDRIDQKVTKVKSLKDLKSIQHDLLTVKQTIDSVLENPSLFPHIDITTELPQRMAFFQSMSARVLALKRSIPMHQNEDTEPTDTIKSTLIKEPNPNLMTTWHFQVPSTEHHKQLDHLINIVGNVRTQAHQINTEINAQKSWLSRIETHFTSLDQGMERVSKRAVLAYRRSSRNDRAVMATVLLLILFLIFLTFL